MTCEECRERKRGEKGEREGNKVGVGLDREGGERDREGGQSTINVSFLGYKQPSSSYYLEC